MGKKRGVADKKPLATANSAESKAKAKLLQQMEFYLSDSNLRFDKFLQQELTKDPSGDGWLTIDLFAKFKRIQQISDDKTLLIEALRQSKELVLDQTESKVRRKQPVKADDPTEVDARTIYAENLPPKYDHDKLREVFQQFGKVQEFMRVLRIGCRNVQFISIPRDKETRQFKGYAFIEYGDESSVRRCRKDGAVTGCDIYTKKEWIEWKEQKGNPGKTKTFTGEEHASSQFEKSMTRAPPSKSVDDKYLQCVIRPVQDLKLKSDEIMEAVSLFDEAVGIKPCKSSVAFIINFRSVLACKRTWNHYQKEEHLVVGGVECVLDKMTGTPVGGKSELLEQHKQLPEVEDSNRDSQRASVSGVHIRYETSSDDDTPHPKKTKFDS